MRTHLRALSLTATLSFSATALAGGAAPSIHVYKSPSCGCCTAWIEHLEDHGFTVTATDTDNMARVKADAGLMPGLGSCHTAFVGDYVIEGHVPADDIHRLLEQAPKARGLSVPGMPIGSPGMEMGQRRDAYQVLLFNGSGQTRVFSEYPQRPD